MTTPMPGPWLSPQVLIVKSFPKLFGIVAKNRAPEILGRQV
jgi:hypothetical protein